tara:strand:+ start:34061 stop:34471 length:411 start_codon:yes stop_codon:yes gene_type:complete
MADQDVIEQPQTPETEASKSLILSVASAVYNEDKQLASIKLTSAFQKSQVIMAHDGKDITLTYQDHVVTNPEDCPKIEIFPENVGRDISLFGNSVTLDVSKITPDQADLIDNAQCFRVDTQTVKQMIDPSWSMPKI